MNFSRSARFAAFLPSNLHSAVQGVSSYLPSQLSAAQTRTRPPGGTLGDTHAHSRNARRYSPSAFTCQRLPQRLLPLSDPRSLGQRIWPAQHSLLSCDLRSLGGSRTLGIVSRCPSPSSFGSCRSLRDSDSITGRRSRLNTALLTCCCCVH